MSWQEDELPETPDVAPWHTWVETAVIAAAAPLLGLWLRPKDPFFLQASFCWPLMGPLLASLRYGSGHGMICSAAMLATMAAWSGFHVPGQLAEASLLMALLAGGLSDRLSRKLERAERLGRLAIIRSRRFIRAYHSMTASHELLERQLQRSGSTLREALAALRRRLASEPASRDAETRAHQTILEIFAEHAGAHVAAFHRADRHGRLLAPEVAVGTPPLIPSDHPMLREAVTDRKVVSIPPDRVDEPGLIAAVPLVDVTGSVAGVIAVHETPFQTVGEDALQLMAVLGGAAADLLATCRRPAPETAHQAFVTQIRRALHDRQRCQLESAVACLAVDDPQGGRRLAELSAERRGSDFAWVTQDAAGEPVLAVLLPVTGQNGADAFLSRLQDVVRSRRGRDVTIVAKAHALTAGDSVESLVSFVREPRLSHEIRGLRRVGV